MADTPAADPPSESIRGSSSSRPGSISLLLLAFQEGQDTEAPRDFVGGSGFGQSSSDTYGGMSGGQMVMGSAMGAGGAQFDGGGFGYFGGSSFSQPQQD